MSSGLMSRVAFWLYKMFRGDMLPPVLNSEDEGNMFLRNICIDYYEKTVRCRNTENLNVNPCENRMKYSYTCE
jgi:hypothetical protein